MQVYLCTTKDAAHSLHKGTTLACDIHDLNHWHFRTCFSSVYKHHLWHDKNGLVNPHDG